MKIQGGACSFPKISPILGGAYFHKKACKFTLDMTINRQNFPPAAGKRGALIFLRFSDSENSGVRLLISENLLKSAGGRLLRGGGYS